MTSNFAMYRKNFIVAIILGDSFFFNFVGMEDSSRLRIISMYPKKMSCTNFDNITHSHGGWVGG